MMMVSLKLSRTTRQRKLRATGLSSTIKTLIAMPWGCSQEGACIVAHSICGVVSRRCDSLPRWAGAGLQGACQARVAVTQVEQPLVLLRLAQARVEQHLGAELEVFDLEHELQLLVAGGL